MSYVLYLECSKCKKEYSADKIQTVCQVCNAPLVAVYDLEGVKESFSKSDLKSRRPDMWRYVELLPIKG